MGLYHLFSGNKGAHQLHGYTAADLHLCFAYTKSSYSQDASQIVFAGICLGLQCAVAEFARNELKMADANSTEFVPDTKYPVVIVYFILDSAHRLVHWDEPLIKERLQCAVAEFARNELNLNPFPFES